MHNEHNLHKKLLKHLVAYETSFWRIISHICSFNFTCLWCSISWWLVAISDWNNQQFSQVIKSIQCLANYILPKIWSNFFFLNIFNMLSIFFKLQIFIVLNNNTIQHNLQDWTIEESKFCVRFSRMNYQLLDIFYYLLLLEL